MSKNFTAKELADAMLTTESLVDIFERGYAHQASLRAELHNETRRQIRRYLESRGVDLYGRNEWWQAFKRIMRDRYWTEL